LKYNRPGRVSFLDTNVLVFDTFEDGFHAEAATGLDSIEKRRTLPN
jgi:predicted nucleic acid-binding protein